MAKKVEDIELVVAKPLLMIFQVVQALIEGMRFSRNGRRWVTRYRRVPVGLGARI